MSIKANQSQMDCKFNNVDMLQEALESQIDIVLRLEEERLKLLKENKEQRQTIEDLSSKEICRKNEEIQLSFSPEKKNQLTQTGENNELFSKNQLLEEANKLFNKHNNKMKASGYNQMESDRATKFTESNLQSKRSNNSISFNHKENIDSSNKVIPKISEKDLLIQEIVKLTKENNSFKFQLRAFTETIKKLEKENIEVKKSSDVKSETLEKLRKEVSDLSKILNTDRFKSIKSMEGDLFKALSLNKSLQQELIQKDKENIVMQKDFEHLKEILEKINMDVNFSSGNQIETQKLIEKKIAEQEKIIEEMRKDLELKQEHLKLKDESIKEVSIQNDSLHDEVEYFKNMAKSSKNHADKAINDLEFYRNKMVEFQSLKSQN